MKFIRYKSDIICLDRIEDIDYHTDQKITRIHYIQGETRKYNGDVRDELWELIQLALKPKGVTVPITQVNGHTSFINWADLTERDSLAGASD